MSRPPARRTLWDVAVGVVTSALVFGAVPAVLVAFVGLPAPHRWTAEDVMSLHGLFDLLAVVSWCAWAGCAFPILRSAAARVRSRDVDAAVRLSDRIGLRIALGILAMSSFVGLAASVAGASGPASAAAGALHGAIPAAPVAQGASPARIRWHDDDRGTTSWAVRDGDTLPSVAAARYGDPADWPAIASANLGRLMDDGTRFVDPSAITPGWTLRLPVLDAQIEAAPRTPSHTAVDTGTRGALATIGSLLPIAELAAAGVSALVAALLARRAAQLRRLQAFLREEGQPSPVPTERDAHLGSLVAPFEHAPILEIVEAAACHLGGALATLDPSPGPVQWLRAGRDGVEVRFAEPLPQALDGWHRTPHSTWLLPATVDVVEVTRSIGRNEPWCATLLPLGDDERGTWLLPVVAPSCVAVVGPRAVDLVLAMRASVASWSWHEALVVTDDPREASEIARRHSVASAGESTARPSVLFVGNPKSLPPAARAACAVIAPGQVDDADVTVVVDSRGASAHPFGITVRPPLLDCSWAHAVDALGSVRADWNLHDQPVQDSPVQDSPVQDSPVQDERTPHPGTASSSLVHRGTAPATLRLVDPSGDEPAGEAPGQLVLFSSGPPSTADGDAESLRPARTNPARGRAEVRLLGTVPGIVGLQADLPPKRARRAVELVAYLAVHAPDPVTGDRLRTRVLGSPDADAAAKTLFNTIGAARRALGTGPDGALLLPPASRSGHYRLSPMVTVDAGRAWTLLRDGLASRDPGDAVGKLREGLELVRGEPLGGVLTGYGWWQAEGHERRVADAVVDGACALVRAALSSDDIDLARWAVAQARKVEPYCEPLTRAAMRVAAASGDARRLHSEWQDCCRQMDELDPGGSPSERTEQVYVLLRAQLAGAGTALQA